MHDQETSSQQTGNQFGLRSFSRWLAEIGVTETTGWRWRKRGWVETVNISGRHYLSEAEIRRFESRATTGEFAQAPAGCAARKIGQIPEDVKGGRL